MADPVFPDSIRLRFKKHCMSKRMNFGPLGGGLVPAAPPPTLDPPLVSISTLHVANFIFLLQKSTVLRKVISPAACTVIPVRHATNKHWDPKWRKHRAHKFIKVSNYRGGSRICRKECRPCYTGLMLSFSFLLMLDYNSRRTLILGNKK